MATQQVLILPGYGNSGEAHWQTLWQRSNPTWVRISQKSWEAPQRADWVSTLQEAVFSLGPNTLLVSHSLACLAVAHWVAGGAGVGNVAGALLVAPPDPLRSAFPSAAKGFAPVPCVRFPFPSIVVSSTDDPYSDAGFTQELAHAWGSRLVCIGAAGHINAQSGLGAWPEGLSLLRQLASQAGG